MSPLLLLLAIAAAAALAALWPRIAARLTGRGQAGAALLAAAILLFLLRQPALGAPVGALAVALLRGAFRQGGGAIPGSGGRSEVRSGALVMWLDHDSGDMGGEVLTGRFAGRNLAGLDAGELQDLAAELAGDDDSLGLMLAYLERRGQPAGGGDGGGPKAETPIASDREMSVAEALRVLGLSRGASREEVRAAHRRLMMRVHPDLGGSDALAAMINAAKARLDP